MSEPRDLLIGDAERTTAAAALREHYEAGRLTFDEFETRLDTVNAARTELQLQRALDRLPTAALPTFRPRDTRWRSLALQYAALNALALVVWLATGAETDNFWPKWMFVATLILFVRRTLGHSNSRRHRALEPPAPPPPPHEQQR